MFHRDIITDLLEWKKEENRKPLILRGARQVGKTSTVHLFGKSFKQYVYLNLELPKDRKLFEEYADLDHLVQALFFDRNQNAQEPDTLIFIDEIQAYPPAIQQLRYFLEQKPELFVIAAGSLLESVFDIDISFPVGRVSFLAVRPLSFSEFLAVTGEDQALKLLQTVPVPDFAHTKLLQLFHRYTLIGGMPEIVKAYAEKKDLTQLPKLYDGLLIPYLDDVAQYASNEANARVLRHIIQTAMTVAGSRITFHGFGKSNYKSREIGEAFRTLEKAFFVKLIYPVTQNELPLLPDIKKSPRLQLLDTGLVNYYSGIQKQLLGIADLNGAYRGRITEHIVYQELLSLEKSLLHHPHFWVRDKKTSQAEVDVVLPIDGKLIPVEIKSGAAGKLRSLHQFMNRSDLYFGVRLYAGKFSIEKTKTIAGKPFWLINLPYFAVSQIEAYIKFYLKRDLR
ncbi:MAG: AAA family ATPase [Leeuwenhoekiella sp.]